ncbi:hypothetical protein V8C86DRAFT_161295 [Haematococcus lacustris]
MFVCVKLCLDCCSCAAYDLAPGGPCLSMQRGLRVVAAMVAVVVTMAVVVAATVVAAGATVVAEGAMVVVVAVAMVGSGQATKRGRSNLPT